MPDFQQLSSGIIFDEESSDSSDEGADDFNSGSRFYFFTCPIGQESNLVAQYANNLINAGQFQLIKYYNYSDGAKNFYAVQLKYVGSKKVAEVYSPDSYDPCNVGLYGAMNEGFVVFNIATGLTYGNERENSASISTPNQPARASGVDVPDFMTIGGNSVVYRTSQVNGDGSITVFYDAYLNDDLRQDFIGQYANLLTQYGFHFVRHDETKFNSKRLKENRKSETWTFQNSNYDQVKLKRVRDKSKGQASFDIRMTSGLTYGGNYATPQRKSGGNAEGEMCWRCRGTGICQECGGSGHVHIWAGNEYIKTICNECRSSGTCRWCGGTGKA